MNSLIANIQCRVLSIKAAGFSRILQLGVVLNLAVVAHATERYATCLEYARQMHGTEGELITRFLVNYMPAIDQQALDPDYLNENLDYVLKSRTNFPWTNDIPEEIFLNDVAPYAVLDEPRTVWRKSFYELAEPIVRDCSTATEAVQALNQHFFDKINVHYNTARERVNQSPEESIEQGMATCTGLSIILVYACRAVGIPARVAGIAEWPDRNGNHTWVEIWHDGKWHFTGADEFTPKGLNQGWFKASASRAIESERKHAIWATSWKSTGEYFPLIWDYDAKTVSGVNVTDRYKKIQKQTDESAPGSMRSIYLRTFKSADAERAPVKVHFGKNTIITRSGRADMNDMPSLLVPMDGPWLLGIETGTETVWAEFYPKDLNKSTLDIHLDSLLERTKRYTANTRQEDAELKYSPMQYIAYRINEPLMIDGKLDESAWKKAAWTSFFVDIEGPHKTTPRYRTRAKMLWDEEFFYIAAHMEEPHLWATLTKRDSVIYYDNDFEVFIDPDGDTHNYYELELNAFNTIWDLFLTKPYRDKTKALFFWDIRGLKSAVNLNGTVNDPTDEDRGWTVELAFPCSVLEEANSKKGPPEHGDYWRVNFSRVQWQLEVVDGKYQKVINPQTGKSYPEDNWVWSPTGKINMHMPERWGFVHFSESEVGTTRESFDIPVDEAVKWALRQVYYKQRVYFHQNGSFAENFGSLELSDPGLDGYQWPPAIQSTWNLFEARISSNDHSSTWHISQDGKTWKTEPSEQ